MDEKFDFVFSGRVRFGCGSRFDLPDLLEQHSYQNVCVVVDQALAELEMVVELLDSLRCDHLRKVICDISEPTYAKLDEKRLRKGEKVDVVIGIGGGSALDMAKAVSVLSTNLEDAIVYRGFDMFKNAIPPIIALPTTAGTGSEITPNASFIDSDSKRKMGINGEAIRPKFAILDPELTLSCPLGPTISAAVDSMVHATEAFVAKKTNPLARLCAAEGFSTMFSVLPKLIHELDCADLRKQAMYGSFVSAIALMNSGTGPAAALSYPLGVHFGVPHGLGGAMFLPEVARYNIQNGVHDYVGLLKKGAFEEPAEELDAHRFLEELEQLWGSLEIPTNLSKYGVISSDVDLIVKDTLELAGALEQNPAPFGEKQIRNIIENFVN